LDSWLDVIDVFVYHRGYSAGEMKIKEMENESCYQAKLEILKN
jgi:hypothetical protein